MLIGRPVPKEPLVVNQSGRQSFLPAGIMRERPEGLGRQPVRWSCFWRAKLYSECTVKKGLSRALLGAVCLWLANTGASAQTSLRFFGNGVADIDRVKIPLDAPARPADIGATDFTLEFWMKANPGENGSGPCSPGNDSWIVHNILFDRDVFGPGDFGDYGISLGNGRIAFGASTGGSGDTLCGAIPVANGAWHHIAVTRRASDGEMRLFVDGQPDGQTFGAAGDMSYRDGRPTSYPGSDPFLVIGAEKHDAGPAYPSFSGWIDEVRLSTTIRYSGAFTRPSQPFATDPATAALYHLDEAIGDAVADSSGAAGGPSHGVRRFGGSPAGPLWSSDIPFTSSQRALVFHTVAPCRVLDTRDANGPYGGPPLAAGPERTFAIAGRCGVPASASVLSCNVTVTGSTAPGHLTFYPVGSAASPTSTINFRAGQTRASDALLSPSASGGLAVAAGISSGSVHLIMDVSGYFE